jgi:sterol 3beta-glucosyltransferase
MHLTLLTAGSRGDTTPFAALALGLQAAGHRVRLAGCRGFAPTARLYGLDYFALDAAAHRRSQPAALEQLQAEAWQACQGTQAIVYDPFTLLSGYCLAQQMRVPAVAAALAPFGPTAAHPAWAVYSGPRLGAAYNRLTHTLAEQAAWQVARGPVQKFWRQRGGAAAVGLAGPYARQAAEQFPVVYGYSPHVLPRPPIGVSTCTLPASGASKPPTTGARLPRSWPFCGPDHRRCT